MDIRESAEHVLASKKVFGEIFYEEFFRRSPDAIAYFEGVDMERQAVMLTMAVPAIAHHTRSGSTATEKYFRNLAAPHEARKIPPALYTRWCEAMLVALEYVLGKEWTAELAREWESGLEQASRLLVEGYEDHHGV